MSRSRAGLQHGAPTRAFDVWLERKLHQMFDSVADEPMPQQFESLLERIARRNEREISSTAGEC